MSAASSSRCLLCTFRQIRPQRIPVRQRQIHSSPVVQAAKSNSSDNPAQAPTSQQPQVKNLNSRQGSSAVDGKSEKGPQSKGEETDTKPKYTTRQIEAIRAAEEILPPGETLYAANLDRNPWRVKYLEDFTQMSPILDKPVKNPWENIDEDARLKTAEEIDEDLMRLMENLPENDQKAVEMFERFDQNFRVTVGSEKHEREPRSAMAPILPKVEKEQKQKAGVTAQQGDARPGTVELAPQLIRLMQATGYTEREIRGLNVKTIVTHAVVNQTRLGKVRKMYTLSIAGNENGLIGYGEGKADDSLDALFQSQYKAIRNMQPILRYENRTIFGNVKGKSGATELELFARPPGESYTKEADVLA